MHICMHMHMHMHIKPVRGGPVSARCYIDDQCIS